VQGGDKTVSIVMDLLGPLLPDEPQERAQGPLAQRAGFAKATAEPDIVNRVAVQGTESEEGVPEGAGPRQGGGGWDGVGVEGLEAGGKRQQEGGEVVGRAGVPHVVQRQGSAAAASLTERQRAVPGVADGEAGGDVLIEQLTEADRNVNTPEEGDMSNGIKVSKEVQGHPGRPRGEKRSELGASKGGGRGGDDNVSEEGQRLAVQDRAAVDPARGSGEVSNVQHRGAGLESLLGEEVCKVVHVIVSVGLNLGEPKAA